MIVVIFKYLRCLILVSIIFGCISKRPENIPSEAVELNGYNVYVMLDEDTEGNARYRKWSKEGILIHSQIESLHYTELKFFDSKTGKLVRVYETKK